MWSCFIMSREPEQPQVEPSPEEEPTPEMEENNTVEENNNIPEPETPKMAIEVSDNSTGVCTYYLNAHMT